ncbi:TlpA family protein disulfide reductase [Olleya aquimaris]|uniref:Thiol-disulfide isomerase/thioredoxin n=1 Tax=Olleya aquimaris TaxID=639310 RepID=A0A327RD58_9FLAO|nr:TlpA disulfide reductase family protein [Olleya aquimaris]RAJ14641.1 thiol-disulfide isomerase/thioredoxin [Olleya aquimaris]
MKHFLYLLVFAFSFNVIAQDTLPTSEIKTLDGETTTLKTIAEDNDLIVVSLWATWCVPCKNELDAISEVYNDWQDETSVKLYAISVDDSRTVSRVKPLVNGKDWDFTILLDTNNDLKRELGAATVPLTLLIKNGKIVYRHSGYTPGSEDDLYDEIKKHS